MLKRIISFMIMTCVFDSCKSPKGRFDRVVPHILVGLLTYVYLISMELVIICLSFTKTSLLDIDNDPHDPGGLLLFSTIPTC